MHKSSSSKQLTHSAASWENVPVENLNESLAVHAVQLLTACYFPGVLAAYIQLFRGTKYSRFPNWLDRWLKMRKQLGLLMLFSACLHVSDCSETKMMMQDLFLH